LYTSGSTGHPKGVITHHVTVGQVLHNMMFAGYLSVELSGSTAPPGPLPPQTHLVTVPLFHVTGLFGGFLLPAMLGQKVVLLRKWSAERAMALIEREKVTMLSTVPAILKDLLTDARLGDYDCSSVSRAALAGAATPTDLPDLLRDKLGVTGRATGYGMTESGSVGAAMSGPVFDLNPFAAGIISPIIELRVVDRMGRPRPSGAEGEVELRGVTVTPAAPSPMTGGYAPAIWATSTTTGSSSSPGESRRSSSAVARTSPPWRSRTSPTAIPAPRRSRSSACPTTSWARSWRWCVIANPEARSPKQSCGHTCGPFSPPSRCRNTLW
jgi:acyl-CoA synthetase (AMP-forming)/AMP-acid ligase II